MTCGTLESYRRGCRCQACKAANAAYSRENRAKNKDAESARRKRYRSANLNKIRSQEREQNRRKWECNPEKMRAQARVRMGKWRANNSEKARQRSRESQQQYRELKYDEYRANRLSWETSNKNHLAAYNKKYRESVKGFKRDYQRARQRLIQEITAKSAVNSGQPWTNAERSVALDRSLTVVQAASILGRSARSVRYVRDKFKMEENR